MIFNYKNNNILPLFSDKFSSIDLRKNIDNPGVVYPVSDPDIKDQPSFSSIIKHDFIDPLDKDVFTHISNGEYRVINKDKDQLIYCKNICFTFVYKKEEEHSLIKKKFGIVDLQGSYIHSPYKNISTQAEMFNLAQDTLSELDFNPEFIISDENLTHKLKQEVKPIYEVCSDRYRNTNV